MDLNEKHEPNGSIIPRGYGARTYLAMKPRSPRERDEITLREVWQILLKRRTAFFACLAMGILTALIISLVLPTRYEGIGRLTVDFDSPSSFDMDALAKAAGVDSETKLQTQVNVLQTDALAWDVIKQLRLDQRPETAHRRFILGPAECVTPPNQSFDSIGPECRRMLLDEFHSRLHVQSVPKTEIIEIRFRCKSRELAASVVNTLADTYVEQGFQMKYLAAMRPTNWLSGQLNDVKKDAELAEEKLLDYQRKTGIFGTDENHNVVIERLTTVNQQLVDARANRIVHEARYRVAMTGDPESLAELTPGSTLQVLHTQEADLKNQYAQLDAKYGDAYPKVIQVKAQLEKAAEATRLELDRTRGKIKDQYEAALKSESMLHDEFEKQKLEAYDTNEASIQAAMLKHDVDATRELYEQLVKRLKEAGIIAGLKATNVAVIDPAAIPVSPVEPRPVLNLAMGMFVGSLGGLTLCFLLNNIDTTIASPNDVADVGSLPALGIVPHLSESAARGILSSANRNGASGATLVAALERPESEMADAYRSLRTVLLLPNGGPAPKVHLITSPLPREGKTTTSVNTAVVFAQKKRRVLLVDADLRWAGLHRCLNLRRNGGLSAALTGGDPRESYLPHPELPNLFILPAGARPSKPPDLLDSDRMRELVSLWRQEFDQVIIDAPPVIGLSDAAILATMADTVVLVLRAEQSRRQDLFRAQEILARVDANVAGAIINDFDLKAHGYYGNSPSLYARYFNENGRKRNNAAV
ncbi:MAG TPA: polysaccharide biosynthesis tyrosine autokinase [Terriglobales bacterium]|nr:polysaccharide biosynthesis tyrosine autokinase [Terriglobales bacterium]